MSFDFEPETGGVKLGDDIYGVYWIRTGEIHRSGMTYGQAEAWINDAIEVFPKGNVHDVWGICTAQWRAVN